MPSTPHSSGIELGCRGGVERLQVPPGIRPFTLGIKNTGFKAKPRQPLASQLNHRVEQITKRKDQQGLPDAEDAACLLVARFQLEGHGVVVGQPEWRGRGAA